MGDIANFRLIEKGDLIRIVFGDGQENFYAPFYNEVDKTLTFRSTDGNKPESIKTLHVQIFKDATRKPSSSPDDLPKELFTQSK